MNDYCGICGRPLSLRNGSHWFGYALCSMCMGEATHIARAANPAMPRATVVAAIQQLQSIPGMDATTARLKCGSCERALDTRLDRASESIVCRFCGAKSTLPLSVRKDLWKRQLRGTTLEADTQRPASADVIPGVAAPEMSASGVRFECPVCRRAVIVWHTQPGGQSECSACGAPLTVPLTASPVRHGSSDSRASMPPDSAAARVAQGAARSPDLHVAQPRQANPLATTGFVFGLVSPFFYSFAVMPVLAVVFSSIGLARASTRGSGRALAWIGLVLGSIYFIVAIVALSMGRW